jgi:nitrite reductase/ring-hydroxylating ferredoxin subunit
MKNFSQMTLLDLQKEYQSRGMSITRGEFKDVMVCSISDFDWNHMDQAHRRFIHKTYQNSLRIFISPDSALSLTYLNFFLFLIPVFVFDMRLGCGLFHQMLTFMGLFKVHTFITANECNYEIQWIIVSSKYLKFTHNFLNKKLLILNKVQNQEDLTIRLQRKKLKDSGYGFFPEQRNFETSNTLVSHLRYPVFFCEFDLSLVGDQVSRIRSESIELIIKKEFEGWRIWSAVCSHEGGGLRDELDCDGRVSCPWHGRKHEGVFVGDKVRCVNVNGLKVMYEPFSQILKVSNENQG